MKFLCLILPHNFEWNNSYGIRGHQYMGKRCTRCDQLSATIEIDSWFVPSNIEEIPETCGISLRVNEAAVDEHDLSWISATMRDGVVKHLSVVTHGEIDKYIARINSRESILAWTKETSDFESYEIKVRL